VNNFVIDSSAYSSVH